MSVYRLWDVIVAGAGPGGSSAATWLARQGFSVLLLDKAEFPRDKVCGDGLTPQAIYWLDRLGCVKEVLEHTAACITSCDLIIDGARILTGMFPQDGPYPGFSTLLARKVLDATLASYAVAQGAVFKPGHRVRGLFWLPDSITVETESGSKPVRFRGRLLIGADGANSMVSRLIGNKPREGTIAIAQRAYYEGVRVKGSQLQIYFSQGTFPGYGWLFADDAGRANVGLGYASDEVFLPREKVRVLFANFVATELQEALEGATPVCRPSGWFACFSRPRTLVADRVMLIGDAGRMADPMSGGGIHKAMESAYAAVQTAAQALAAGDCSRRSLSLYEQAWHEQCELDWRVSELFLAVAKNPNLRELYLALLKAIGRLTAEDQQFQNFCAAFFIDAISRSAALSPLALLRVIPLSPGKLLAAGGASIGAGTRRPSGIARAVVGDTLRMAGRVATNPLQNLDWGMEIMTRLVGLMGCYAAQL